MTTDDTTQKNTPQTEDTKPETEVKKVSTESSADVFSVSPTKPDSTSSADEIKKGVSSSDKKGSQDFTKNRRRSRRPRENVRSEFEQKILDIRRVTRVSSGGRRFSFSVSMVIGDKKGKVGVGTGKAGDTSLAIDKAVKNAKKSLVQVKFTKSMSIPHETSAKYCSAQVIMFPARGRGIIAGSALRDVLELAGLTDINGKIISGTKNKLNIAHASVKALEALETPRESKKIIKAIKKVKEAGEIKEVKEAIKV